MTREGDRGAVADPAIAAGDPGAAADPAIAAGDPGAAADPATDGLPTPERGRWQPLRSGLMNLFLFEDECFHFAGGRLLLRGNNGTGKSRVLALQLPFLLDGEVHPHRVEPDGDPAKRMEWHLLMNGRYPDRIGYTWIEMGRLDPERGPRYLTLGVGLQAIQGRGAPTRWFFLTERRVGQDLRLMTEGRTPLSRPRLEEQIGARGEVFVRARDYRDAVDRALFGLGRERYEALLELLIQLRRPQLSRKLDEEQLNRALSDAMPPLSDGVLGEVAEAFRELEADRAALRSFALAVEATEQFIRPYRRYAQIVTRRRAEGVRQAHSRYESTLRALREAESRIEQAEREQAGCLERLSFLEQALGAAEVEIRTLESSDEMRSARELDHATREAARAAREAEAAAHRFSDADAARLRREIEHAAARAERRARQADAQEDLAACEAWVAETGLARAWRSVAEGFAELLRDRETETPEEETPGEETPGAGADASRAHPEGERASLGKEDVAALAARAERGIEQLRGQVEARRQAVHHLEGRQAELAKVERRLLERKRERERLQEALSDAQEQRHLAGEARRRARDLLVSSYDRWARDVVELSPPCGAELEEAVTAWAEVGHGPTPVAMAVEASLDAALAGLHEARAAARAKLQEEQALLAEVEGELAELRAGRHRPPVSPATRDPEARVGREGAPFWALCELAEGTSPTEHAGIEAALEAMGLLDAWITPTGEIVGDEALDTWLGARGQPVSGPTLADKLRPLRAEDVEDSGAGAGLLAVDPEGVRAVLQRIGLGPSEAPVWVDREGRYGLGPARGRWRKGHAEHLGASAREAARLRRVSALEAARAERLQGVAAAEASVVAVDERVERAHEERRAAPGDEALRDALAAMVQAEREVALRRVALEEAEARVQEAGEQAAALAAVIAEEVADLGLSGWVDRLGALREILVQLLQAVHGLGRWVRQLVTVRRSEIASAERERLARGLCDASRQEAEQARGAAMRAESARRVLEETSGARAQEVLERLQRVRARWEHFREEQRRQQGREREVDRSLVAAQADRRNHEQNLEERSALRQEAVAALTRLVESGLPRLARAYGEDRDAEAPATIGSPTGAVELARRMEKRLDQVDISPAAWDRATGALHRRIGELETELGVHGWRPRITERDGLRLVTVTFQGGDRTLDELARLLREEVAERQRILAESERQVIESHLIDEVSAQIHERLREGERLVARMNAELEARPTSTGMRLRFAWEPRKDDPPGWSAARKLLLSTQAIWSPEERGAIGRFLQQRIEAVRVAGQTLTWRDQLAEAFDYRRWHRFVVSRFQDGAWHPLTRRTHGTGSGGEKALALTLPQLAAAAAHYGSAHEHAPRLILLDEAFVGVDRTMRGHCMGLLTAFDLDFVMTSEREWGCYATVPALAIYQLTRHPDLDAVYTTRWVWNGAERQRPDVREGSAHRGGRA